MSDSPAGWSKATLADVAKWGSGGTPRARDPKYYGGSIPWAVIGDLNDSLVSRTRSKVTEAAIKDSSAKIVPAGAVLIAMYGSIGKLGIAACEMATNQAIAHAIPHAVDNRYLFYYLLSQRNLLVGAGKGGTQQNISQTVLRSWPIVFPESINEQRIIVDILDDHLSRLDAGMEQLSSARIRADAWFRGLADVLVWGQASPTQPIGELLREPMRNGRSDRRIQESQSGTRTLTITAVTRNEFIDKHTKLTTSSPEVAESLWLRRGDIFVQRANTPELVGTAARYSGPDRWAIFPDLLIRLRADERVIDSRYLVAAIRTERTHREFRTRAKGLAGSMPKIDQRTIATTVIPVPLLDEQLRVVESLRVAELALVRVREAIEKAQIRASHLRSAILAAAFSGRLTAEIAEELTSA